MATVPTRKQVVEAMATIALALYAEPSKKPKPRAKKRSSKKKARKR